MSTAETRTMPPPPPLSPEERTREVMRFIVERSDGKIGRTRLVKLMYLADLEARRYMGRPITGMDWRRENFGPFDSSGFYNALDHLKGTRVIHETVVDGGTAPGHGYQYSGTGQPHATRLGMADLAVLAFILKEYGNLSRQSLVEDIVYETGPFKKVQNEPGSRIPMQAVDNEMRRALGGVSLEELLRGEEEIRCGRFVTLDDLRRGLDGQNRRAPAGSPAS